MHNDRAKKLRSINIDILLRDIFGKQVRYKSIGHDHLDRNRVFHISEYNVVFKLYGEIERWNKEIKALYRIQGLQFTIPLLIHFGVSYEVGWIIMSNIEGVVLQDIYYEKSQEEKRQLWFNLGEKLSELHKENSILYDKNELLLFKESKLSVIDCFENINIKYSKWKEKIINKVYYNQEKVYLKCFGFLDSYIKKASVQDKVKVTWCHNDFGLRNIIYNPTNNKMALIDFEVAEYAQREKDLANVLLNLNNSKYAKDFLNGYFKLMELDKETTIKINFYLLLKCVDVCSWAYDRAYEYYTSAYEVITKMLCELEKSVYTNMEENGGY